MRVSAGLMEEEMDCGCGVTTGLRAPSGSVDCLLPLWEKYFFDY